MINYNQACFLCSLVLAVGCDGDILPGGSIPVNAAGAVAQGGAEDNGGSEDVNEGGEAGAESSGGVATGGARSGGVSGLTGGSLTGGRATGGTGVGGTLTGGASTGGLLTGGLTTGGTGTGGVNTGLGGTGAGSFTGGVSPGGSLTYDGGTGGENHGGFAGSVTGNGGEAGLGECSGAICPTDTGYVCVSLRSNNKHCGACGVSCGTSASCVGFECVCAVSDHSFCDGICVDLSFENDNCGLCGDVCGSNTVCSNGECVNSVADKIEIRSYIEDGFEDLENKTCPLISLFNISSEEISTGELSIRYWYTKDGTTTDQIAELLSSSVSATASTVRLAERLYDSDFVLVVDIATNQTLSGNSSIEFQPCVHGTAQWITGYKLDNDWSYQVGNYEVNERITVYQSGHLIWGDEPCPLCLRNQICNDAVCQWNITDLPANTHIYSYSWSEASSGCSEQGRRLCTISEIQAAYDAGFRRCQQGWTEDQAILTPDDGENCGGDGVSIVWAPTSQESNAHCCQNN